MTTFFFLKKHTSLTTVYAAHVPLGFLCLNGRKRDNIKLFKIKSHSIAVGLWARPPVLSPALSRAGGSSRSSPPAWPPLILRHCDEWRMVSLAVLFVRFQRVGEINGHVIFQLKKANDLPA